MNNECKDCTNTKCKYCYSNNPLQCFECPNEYPILFEKECWDVCPNGSYKSDNTCKRCTSPCETCSSDAKCLTCMVGFDYNPTTKTCIKKCENNNAFVNGKCVPCTFKNNCLICNPDKLEECKKCDKNMFLYNGVCVIVCPRGTFTSGSNCINCLEGCAKCPNSTQCNECSKDGNQKYLYKKKECIPICRQGQYVKNYECIDCNNKKCEICNEDNTNKCLKCPKNSYLYNGECIDDCPDGTWADENSLECKSN